MEDTGREDRERERIKINMKDRAEKEGHSGRKRMVR
jgi:hypothetical protein